ncbi:transporter substrate-binding domain-containing protein [Streptococcaceae bacterium ESL0687]|nr:transporter substrate-binding domain-containing protein [Streptococcaceae bacterium ESL0687]
MKKFFAGLLLTLSVVSLVGCGGKSSSTKDDSLQKIKDKGELVVALSPDYAPFEFQMIKDGKNVVVGSDIDLANKIAEKIGVKVKISTMDFSNVLASVANGSADLAISGLTATDERKKTFDFSDEYYQTKNVLVVNKDKADKYKSIADLKGAKIAAQKGSIQEGIVTDTFKDSTLISLPTATNMVNELKNNTVDAIVLDGLVAESYVESNDDIVIEKDITFPADTEGSNAIAIKKGNDSLKDEVNTVIAELKKEGYITKSVEDNYKLAKEAKVAE